MRKVTLSIIRAVRKVFYNTPIHRLTLTTLLYERLFHLAYPPGEIVRVAYENCIFDVPTLDITILPSLLNGCYEACEFALLSRRLGPGMTFVDVGANIGLYTVAAAKLVGATGRVYAFEPEPGNYALLQHNLELNEARNVVTEKMAVGCAATERNLNISRNSIGTHSLLRRPQSSVAADREAIQVQVITLDEYFADVPGRVDTLKVDVEGYEPFVLKGAARLLARVELILFEYSRSDVQAHFGIVNLIRLLDRFPYLYGINERTGRIEALAPAAFQRTKYMNVAAARVAL